MEKAYIFKHGRSQAVRLPKAYRFEDGEVTIEHHAGGVLLMPKERLFSDICAALDTLESGFKMKRDQHFQQTREEIKL
jgi:antitoxin VapB